MAGIKPSPLTDMKKQRRSSIDKAMLLQGNESKDAAEISAAVGESNERFNASAASENVMAKRASAVKAMEKQGVAHSQVATALKAIEKQQADETQHGEVEDNKTTSCCSVQ